MGDLEDLYDHSDATALATAIRSGDVSARAVLELAITRVAERNDTLNAVTETCFEAARRAVDDDAAVGPFAGVPFVVKDLGMDVAGMRRTGGSRLWADAVATADSELVRRYRAAGLVVVGTTNTPELGRSASTEPLLHGPTRNPHDLERSPGGSSGGTAAAVAGGLVPLGHGNDGGGSIRIPASACGLVGLKPTRARTPSRPRLGAFAYPLGINHALTRTVRDTALLLDLTRGPTSGDAIAAPPPTEELLAQVGVSPGRLRIAWSGEAPGAIAVDPECLAGVSRTAALLETLGHDVVETSPQVPVDDVAQAMRVVMSAPIAADIDGRLAELGRELRDEDLEPFTHMLYRLGKGATATDMVDALRAVEHAGHVVGPFFETHDVLLTPTLAVPPPRLGTLDTTSIDAMVRHAPSLAAFTSVANVTGQPALSLPLERFADGMPMGMQLTAAFGREDLLVRLAAQLEEARPWPTAPAWPAGSSAPGDDEA